MNEELVDNIGAMFTGKRVFITGAAAYKHAPMMEDNLAQVICKYGYCEEDEGDCAGI